MLRDELEISLNDLIIAVREASHAYEVAAEISSDNEQGAFLKEAAAAYGAQTSALEDEQRALGHLPKAPDAEKRFLLDSMTHLKANLVENEIVVLMEERNQEEDRIVDCGREVLRHSPPETLGAVVEQTIERAHVHARRLDEVLRDLREAP